MSVLTAKIVGMLSVFTFLTVRSYARGPSDPLWTICRQFAKQQRDRERGPVAGDQVSTMDR
jgi:hypothetical protein